MSRTLEEIVAAVDDDHTYLETAPDRKAPADQPEALIREAYALGAASLDPPRHRAEQAVIRLARGISEGKVWYPDKLAAALARLDRVTGAKGGKR